MTSIDTVVIGAGHAGLAVSRLLSSSGRDHVVLDRGGVAERWRSERWDSLHLLTPNWMTRLPGWSYRARSPRDTCPPAGSCPTSRSAPPRSTPRCRAARGSRTSRFTRDAPTPDTPSAQAGEPRALDMSSSPPVRGVVPTCPPGSSARGSPWYPPTRTATRQAPPGGVLVVGASASGVQIADELARSGRDVVLAVGGHTGIPRHYRGMEIFWWFERTGRLARTIDDSKDPARLRAESSLQLIGRNGSPASAYPVDLAALQDRGVQLAGRFDGVHSRKARFRDDLAESVSRSDARLHRLLGASTTTSQRLG